MNEPAAGYRQLIRTVPGFARSGIASPNLTPARMPVSLPALTVV